MFESDLEHDLDERLRHGELDVSFVVGDVAPAFEARHLLTDPFVVVARPDQFPAGPITVDELANHPMIGQHANSCQLMNEAGLRAAGLNPSYVFRSNDNGTVAAMVRAGMGIAVLPLLCTEPEDPRIALHPVDPPMAGRQISIAWRSGVTLAPAVARFVELAIDASTEVADRMLPVG